MNKSYNGDYAATILSYDPKSRTAKVSIPTVTDGVDEGITATFAYPVGHDDKDTEIQILDNAECYVFFLQGDPYSPVIWAYRSHGTGAIVDYRRIRQANIELFAAKNINLTAEDTITLKAQTVVIDAKLIVKDNAKLEKNLTVDAESDLKGTTRIENKPYGTHGHLNVQTGNGTSGGVAP